MFGFLVCVQSLYREIKKCCGLQSLRGSTNSRGEKGTSRSSKSAEQLGYGRGEGLDVCRV